jgi:hypothetical protein
MEREYLEKLARSMAESRGIDPDIYVRLISRESGFDSTARSEKGALGIAQIMPDTARDPGYEVRPIRDRLDPVESLRFGADYLSAMLGKYDGNYEKALAAYNAGPGRVDQGGGLPRETVSYVDYILGPTRGPRSDGEFEVAEVRPRARPVDFEIPVVSDPELIPARPFIRPRTLGRAVENLGVASLYDFS